MLESLEHRRLLSAVLEDGVLNVGGTNGDDEIELSLGASDTIVVDVNGVTSSFQASLITRVVVNANAGNDRVRLSPDGILAVFPPPPQYALPTLVLGGRGNDTIRGGSGNDTLDGGTGVNELDGRAGDDLFRAGNTDTDIFHGGGGTDTVDYTGRTQRLNITLDDVDDDGALPPEIWIGPFTFVPERDNVHGDIENVIGGRSADEITGNAANNILSGGGGDDMLFGGFGRDILNGNWGNDRLIGGAAADLLLGGAGNDTVDYSDHAEAVMVSLDGFANDGSYEVVLDSGGGDVVSTLHKSIESDNVKPDVENVVGTEADDRLTGNDASNTLDGRGGDDVLDGGKGNDLLRGGDGNDRFWANDATLDTIRGGDGDDVALADDIDLVIGATRGEAIFIG